MFTAGSPADSEHAPTSLSAKTLMREENMRLRKICEMHDETERKEPREKLRADLDHAQIDLKIERDAATDAYKKLAEVCETCKRKKGGSFECWGCRYDELLGYTVRLRGGLVTIHDTAHPDTTAHPISKSLLDITPPEIRLATLPSDILRWAVVGAGLAVAAWSLLGGRKPEPK